MLGIQKLKVITTLHGTDITLVGNDISFYSITKWSLEQSDAITAVSCYLRNETVNRFCCEDEIVVIPNFVDVQQFNREQSSVDRTSVRYKELEALSLSLASGRLQHGQGPLNGP